MKKIKKSIFAKWKENKILFEQAKNKTYSSPNDDVVLSVQHLIMIFKTGFQKYKKAVDDVSFEVKKGQFHGFIGNNGAGKTTTIRSMLGFYPSFIGKIYINGINAKNHKSKHAIGYVPEVSIFPTTLSAIEYLYSLAGISGLSKKEVDKKIIELSEKYEFVIPDLEKSPAAMSSGQKKTISLLQALLNDPDVIIMDEPAANLDPSSRYVLYNILRKLHQDGKTIFISSHILDELEKYIDSYTLLDLGKVIYSGKLEKYKENGFNTKLLLSNIPSVLINFLKQKSINYEIKNNAIYCNLNPNNKFSLINKINELKLEIIEISNKTTSLVSDFFKQN